MAKTPRVGEQAPDFELPGTGGPFRLSDHRGERIVLLFYPGDNVNCRLPTMSNHLLSRLGQMVGIGGVCT